MIKQVMTLDPASYQRHSIHGLERSWAETNCYVDVWVELLHALGFEPIAALPFSVAIDFEGDQWTFLKFPLADLYDLYGLDVHELAVWRPLTDHIEEQLALGRPVLVEVDSYYLPDTVGTAYQCAHVKSTVAVNAIDVVNEWLGYFHSQGYYHLNGPDFVEAFHVRRPRNPARLPPYVEFVKRRARPPLASGDLVATSVRLLRRQLRLLPEANPFEKFKARFAADLTWLIHKPLDTFHQYSFATLRQLGASCELAATYLHWLDRYDVAGVARPAAAFADLSTGAKALQFQLARALGRKKPLDLAMINSMAACWQAATAELQANFL